MPLTRQDCVDLDAADPLAGVRGMFELPEGLIYLDGNSLGALPRSVKPRMQAVVEHQWGADLIASWNNHDWIGLPVRVGAKIARLIGAHADEVIAADSTSVNLFKLAAAALRLNAPRRVILSEAGNFPTDLYILQGLADLLGPAVELRIVEPEQVAGALTEEVALLLLTHVHFRSGRLHDMAALTAAAHAVGALTLWDLSHSAGVLGLQLGRDRADFAVGCGYKYLNGGPGAPAFLYAARRHHDAMRLPLTGWMGHAAPFDFEDGYRPAPGLRQGLVGTPPILSMAALDAALDVFEGLSMADVRRKSQSLTGLFLRLVEERCDGFGLDPACPADQDVRGGQASLRHPEGYALVQALIAAGVVGDFRAPDVLRFGFAPLYVRHADVWDAVDRLREILAAETWREPRFQTRRAVT
jgi:kynureninase